MNTPEEARAYLEKMLPSGEMAQASRLLRKNHAYIEQYIRRGKPRWLSEVDRLALAHHYPSIDTEKLRPPTPSRARTVRPYSGDQGRLDTPESAKVADDPRTLQLLEIWSQIAISDYRDLALRLLRQLAGDETD